ncbi:hypothetical protein ACFY4C_15030 [Actinomadura viridis]|uniref:hypothetical protein n=1 Tax=Actinomadura viridis TaxID=58110 RepID=UPI0036BB609D
MNLLIPITSLGLCGWGFLVGMFWLPRRFCPWLVRQAASSTLKAAVLMVAVHSAGLVAFGSATFLINEFAVRTLPTWLVTFLFVLAGLVYAPLMGMGFPDRSRDVYGELRRHLKDAGATLAQERAAAWSGGPLAFLGMAVLGMASVVVFGE